MGELLILRWLKPLLQPLIDLIIETDDTGQAEEGIDEIFAWLVKGVKALLWPVEMIVDIAQEVIPGLQAVVLTKCLTSCIRMFSCISSI